MTFVVQSLLWRRWGELCDLCFASFAVEMVGWLVGWFCWFVCGIFVCLVGWLFVIVWGFFRGRGGGLLFFCLFVCLFCFVLFCFVALIDCCHTLCFSLIFIVVWFSSTCFLFSLTPSPPPPSAPPTPVCFVIAFRFCFSLFTLILDY